MNEGTIKREKKGGVIVVEIIKDKKTDYLLEIPEVVCVSTKVQQKKGIWVYQKMFKKKKIFLPHEYTIAVKECVEHPDNLVLSMNGYSMLSKEFCDELSIKPGAYEEACASILRQSISTISNKFPGAALRLIYGASDLGVDKAIEMVARELNIFPLGFSCPKFMFWVNDDDIPVYVANTKDDYADTYIRTLDLLIATGGREHALQHDIFAACRYNKRIHFIDVLSLLSPTGSVPSTKVQPDGSIRVTNAAAAMGRNLSYFSPAQIVQETPTDGDQWDAVYSNISSVTTQVCRNKMTPGRMF